MRYQIHHNIYSFKTS